MSSYADKESGLGRPALFRNHWWMIVGMRDRLGVAIKTVGEFYFLQSVVISIWEIATRTFSWPLCRLLMLIKTEVTRAQLPPDSLL